MRQTVILALLALSLSSAMQAQAAHPASNATWTTVENFAQETFFVTQSTGSLILKGTCKGTQQGNVVVSDTLLSPPQGPFKDIAEAMTALSEHDSHLTWVRDENGYIRVNDSRVGGDLLRIHLKRLHFRGAVNINAAIQEVWSAPEVRAYLGEKHIERGIFFIMPASTKDLPRLSGDLHNVTVAQALDSIVNFFPGMWIYSECTRNSLRRVTLRGAEVGWPGKKTATPTIVE